MLVQILSCIFSVIVVVCIGPLIYGAFLMVGDKQREHIKRKAELVSKGDTDGDDPRSEGEEEDS